MTDNVSLTNGKNNTIKISSKSKNKNELQKKSFIGRNEPAFQINYTLKDYINNRLSFYIEQKKELKNNEIKVKKQPKKYNPNFPRETRQYFVQSKANNSVSKIKTSSSHQNLALAILNTNQNFLIHNSLVSPNHIHQKTESNNKNTSL